VCILYYSISHFATADEFTDTTIRIITIEKRQYGQYVCRAANKLGTAEARVELFGKPLQLHDESWSIGQNGLVTSKCG
jgi:hypothetical protein